MSEFRKDPLSDHWVIIAPNRANRPEQFEADAGRQMPERCPFCRGYEGQTPPKVASYAENGSPAGKGGWQVRVVPNLYPAVEIGEKPLTKSEGIYETRTGVGAHEVIIESPEHVVSFTQLDDSQAALVFHAYRDRLLALGKDPRLAYAQVFKNSGSAAGASLEHTHSQLIATAVVPTQVQHELAKSRAYHQQHDRCVFCVMLEEELAEGTRIVAESQHFVAFCPFASQFPYETWIMPRQHASRFEDAEAGKIAEFTVLLKGIIGRVESLMSDPAFNYLIHTAPFDIPLVSHYHWHLEIFPRLTKTAGFEWGAGDYINTVAPEDAAAILRSAAHTV